MRICPKPVNEAWAASHSQVRLAMPRNFEWRESPTFGGHRPSIRLRELFHDKRARVLGWVRIVSHRLRRLEIPEDASMPKLVLFNVGWMNHYRGVTDQDKIVNGGTYTEENETGGEVWNFLPIRRSCYAYVRSNKGGMLDLERIGSMDGSSSVNGVTIVFTATRPGGGRVVVGWYKNAVVWREERQAQTRGPRRGWGYLAEAKHRDCVLLSPDDRVFSVPRAGQGVWGFGQSNVRYVDELEAKPFIKALSKYISSPLTAGVPTPDRKGIRGRQSDPALRAKVEAAAIERVIDFYIDKGFICKSVERDNVGWDLEVSRGTVTLLVEVKGCSGGDVVVEVTPNEFAQMNRHCAVYRQAIVTNALELQNSRLTVVSYNIADQSWRDEQGRPAHINKIVAARITVPS